MNLTVLAHRGWCDDIARLIVEIMYESYADIWVLYHVLGNRGPQNFLFLHDTSEDVRCFLVDWASRPHIAISTKFHPDENQWICDVWINPQ